MDSPFLLEHDTTYARWRTAKLDRVTHRAGDVLVDVADPRALSAHERAALLRCCAAHNLAIYRSPVRVEDKAIPRMLGAQLGLHRLDANWLADEDCISPIAVADPSQHDRADFIPYTDHAIRWHTDGYYHPDERRILGMVLHCVRPAARGGETAVVDHDLAYIAVRDANPAWIRALMAADAMTIPERADASGVARPAQTGPVFFVDPTCGALHMRYTARTRSIAWKADAATQDAAAFLTEWLAARNSPVLRLTLQSGMGLVCNNVLHDRSAFTDEPAAPRLLYRARYLDRVETPRRAA